MHTSIKQALALGGLFLSLGNAYAAIPNNSNPATFLGPTVKGGYTTTIDNSTAYNVAAELGFRNLRAGATLGWILDVNQRFKVSAEYLTQSINYSYFSGNTYQWNSQLALGGDYQYDFAYNYRPQFDLIGWYSYAPNNTLSFRDGSYNMNGVPTDYLDCRRIAGSNAGGISPGLTIQPYAGTKIGVALNYDLVRYNKSYLPYADANGFGGTAHVDQAITKDIDLGLVAAVRAPYNNYQANLTWANAPYMGRWIVGLDGAYTTGKQQLPNTYNVALTFNYYLDQRVDTKANYKDMKAEAVHHDDGLLAWTSKQAVYMPEVLAIPDRLTLQ